jgi:hypothetical protein
MLTILGELNIDHLKFHLISESGKKMEKEWNERIRRSQGEIRGVLWFVTYIKEKTLGENYNKEAYELWRERNPMMRKNMGEKLLLNQLK